MNLKWKIKYIEKINSMTNDQLFDEYQDVSQSDDYDGIFTKRGEWKLNKVEGILVLRLIDFGFLSESYLE
jgi:hypothetical protein